MTPQKRHTDVTLTKRLDPESGSRRGLRAATEPAHCPLCGALLVNRRWVRAEDVDEFRETEWQPARERVCPGCRKVVDGLPEGIVTADGAFLTAHRAEVEHLLEHEEDRAGAANPLARVMAWNWRGDARLTVSTTTPSLAQRLGRALERSFGGETRYEYSHENRLARVYWHRE